VILASAWIGSAINAVQVPGVFDVDGWFQHAPLPYSGAELAQHVDLEAGGEVTKNLRKLLSALQGTPW